MQQFHTAIFQVYICGHKDFEKVILNKVKALHLVSPKEHETIYSLPAIYRIAIRYEERLPSRNI